MIRIYPDEGGDGDGPGGEGDGVAVQQGQHDPCPGVEQDLRSGDLANENLSSP